jgi:hypothetical protein
MEVFFSVSLVRPEIKKPAVLFQLKRQTVEPTLSLLCGHSDKSIGDYNGNEALKVRAPRL